MPSKRRALRESLVNAAADAVADQYVEVVSLPAFGMVFDAYYSGGAGAREFGPLYEVFRSREEIERATGNALIDPRFKVGSECEALFTYIEEHKASELVDVYFDALRDHLRERLGIRVEYGSSEGELRYLLLEPRIRREAALSHLVQCGSGGCGLRRIRRALKTARQRQLA